MKILQIIDSLGAGGKERQLVELVKGLSKKENIKIMVVVLSGKNHYEYINKLNIEVINLDHKSKSDPIMFFKIYRIIKSFRPDVIQSWNLMCSAYVFPACKILNIPFVNGVVRNSPLKLKVLNKEWFLRKITFPFSNIILGNSYAGLKAYRIKKSKGYCIHNGFDENRMTKTFDTESIKSEFDITTKYVVGMVAAFHERKDYKTFILAAQSILKQRKDISFLAIGDGPTINECKEMVGDNEKANIRFLGRQKNVESLVSMFDIGALATFTEGISNSIMEYMAFGKPTVATDGGGTNELVVDGETGLLVSAGDAKEFASKVLFLIDNKDKATEMGKMAKERLTKEFSLQKMTDSYLEFYTKMVKGA